MKFKEQVLNEFKEVKVTQSIIRADQSAMKSDLQHHIRRTDILEAQIFGWKYRILMYASVIAAVLGVVKSLKSLF